MHIHDFKEVTPPPAARFGNWFDHAVYMSYSVRNQRMMDTIQIPVCHVRRWECASWEPTPHPNHPAPRSALARFGGCSTGVVFWSRSEMRCGALFRYHGSPAVAISILRCTAAAGGHPLTGLRGPFGSLPPAAVAKASMGFGCFRPT